VIVVSDTSPLIALAQLDLFPVLPALFEKIHIPGAVVNELVPHHLAGQRSGLLEHDWLIRQEVSDAHAIREMNPALDDGEAEALSLAVEIGANLLLMDESAGRRAARALGLPVMGTAGIRLLCKSHGHVDLVRPLLDQLITQHRLRIGEDLYLDTLRRSGEVEV